MSYFFLFFKQITQFTLTIFTLISALLGILPQILDELLAARKRAKKDMALATDPMVSWSWSGLSFGCLEFVLFIYWVDCVHITLKLL